MDNNTWEETKEKKTFQLEKELQTFIGKLETIRSNRISLEAVRRLIIEYHREKKPLSSIANLRITPHYELVIRPFESKVLPLIVKVILDKQLGYKVERTTSEEVYFGLSIITQEIREKLVRNVKQITEEGKKNFRLIHQEIKNWLKKDKNLSQDQKRNYEKQSDKLVKDYQEKLIAIETKKIHELNSSR